MFLTGETQWHRFCPHTSTTLGVQSGPGGGFLVGVLAAFEVSLCFLATAFLVGVRAAFEVSLCFLLIVFTSLFWARSYWLDPITFVNVPAFIFLYSAQACTSLVRNLFLSFSNSQACRHLLNSMFLTGETQWHRFCPHTSTTLGVQSGPGGGFLVGVLAAFEVSLCFLATALSVLLELADLLA